MISVNRNTDTDSKNLLEVFLGPLTIYQSISYYFCLKHSTNRRKTDNTACLDLEKQTLDTMWNVENFPFAKRLDLLIKVNRYPFCLI